MASVTLDGVVKVYPNGHVAARGLDLEVADGELLVLVGPSGCGKSTALRIVAGLETPTDGRVRIGDRDVTDVPPQDRDIAMVFQSYALYPHMTVRENLAFSLRMRKAPKREISQRVERAAAALGLEPLLERKPVQLSGGQRQRVALGRAIVREPRAFLFDEPLSNLDAKLRVETRAELARMHRKLGATMVYVTHDQEEAMTLGQRVAVMRDGVLQQVAPPMEVYRRPANRFVAGFVGSPAMNFLSCQVEADGRALRCGSVRVALDAPPADLDGAVVLGVRPHDVRLLRDDGTEGAAGAPDADGARESGAGADARGRVDVLEPLGSEILVHLRLAGREEELRAVVPPEDEVAVDDDVAIRFRRDRLHLFDAASGDRLV